MLKAIQAQAHKWQTLEWEEVMIMWGVGVPERQSSNREVVRQQRKSQMKAICQQGPPSPPRGLGEKGKDVGVSLSLAGTRPETCASHGKLCL